MNFLLPSTPWTARSRMWLMMAVRFNTLAVATLSDGPLESQNMARPDVVSHLRSPCT